MNKRLQVLKYVILDLLAAALAWSLFFFFRKYSFDVYTFRELELIFSDRNFFGTMLLAFKAHKTIPGHLRVQHPIRDSKPIGVHNLLGGEIQIAQQRACGIAFIDVKMPLMDGVETFFKLKEINTGMVTGVLPVVGVPLPLISYGGTSLITILASFGMLMSIHTHRKPVRR